MQDLLGRLTALDPEASMGLRVIACFDELIVGNVNTRALLSAAAALSGCNAGYEQPSPPRLLRVSPKGDVCLDSAKPATVSSHSVGGITVWLERTRPEHANDALILERLSMAMRIRHCGDRREHDNRRDLGVLVDREASIEDRQDAAVRLGLRPQCRYRILTAPLFAEWETHPVVPEDVILTPYGPIHTLVVSATDTDADASPCGIGSVAGIADLHRSFRAATAALRLCAPPETPMVRADDYGGLVELLADSPVDCDLPDVSLIEKVVTRSWGVTTLDAMVRAGTVREAARLEGVHHKTMQSRVDTIIDVLDFDPMVGLGRTRLGVAFLQWRLRHSTVLDLPAPDRDRVETSR